LLARLFYAIASFLLPLLAGAHAQPVKLRAALQLSVTDPFLGAPLKSFADEVERLTEKTLVIEILDKGVPFPDGQIVAAVSAGKVEVGLAGLHEVANKLPTIDILQQPFLFNFDALVRATTKPDAQVRQLIDAAVLEGLGTRILWWQANGSQVVFSKGKDVANPVQLKDQKIRVFGDTMSKMVSLCGGTPMRVTAPKIHESLKNGSLDMAMGAISLLTNRELWHVSDTITKTVHAPIEFVLMINEKTWQALLPQHRETMQSVAASFEGPLRESFAKIEADAYELARQKGMTIRELTADEVADWRACTADVMDDYMRTSADLGKQLMAAYAKLRTEPCCSSFPNFRGFNRR
jgi:C4-dicarboxylate-binding protein DctP